MLRQVSPELPDVVEGESTQSTVVDLSYTTLVVVAPIFVGSYLPPKVEISVVYFVLSNHWFSSLD